MYKKIKNTLDTHKYMHEWMCVFGRITSSEIRRLLISSGWSPTFCLGSGWLVEVHVIRFGLWWWRTVSDSDVRNNRSDGSFHNRLIH